MKKTYIQPQMSTVGVQCSQMLCASPVSISDTYSNGTSYGRTRTVILDDYDDEDDDLTYGSLW